MPQYRTIAAFLETAEPTEAERDLIAKCKAGEECILGDTRPEAPDPTRTIRADLLRLLITGGSKHCGVPDDGVILIGAWITGALNLRFAKARGRIVLHACHFTDQPYLTQARLQQLSLQGSHLPGLFAQGMVVKGDVFLPNLRATGTVDVAGAQIGGQLSCNGAVLDGKDSRALNAQGVTTGQGLFLRNLRATGTVAVNGAQIGGQLSCTGAVLDGKDGPALTAFGVTTGQDLFLRNLCATGTVDVAGAQIGGQLDCTGAVLDSKDGSALNAQGVTTGESLFLRSLRATGTVEVNGAQIGGQLSCTGAVLDGKGGQALHAQRLRVDKGFYWRNVIITKGRVGLTAAHVGDLVDDITCWPTGADQLGLDGFTYDRISSTSPTDATRRLHWLENGAVFKGTLSPQPYTQLAKVLSGLGHDRDARQVLAERERLLAMESRLAGYLKPDGVYLFPLEKPHKDIVFVWHWFFDLLLRWVVGYGYAPMRSLAWLAGLFLFATVLAHFTWTEGSFAPNSDVIITSPGWIALVTMDCAPRPYGPCLPNPAESWSSFGQDGLDWDSFNRYGYAADLVIPILDLGQTDAWAPSKDRGPWGWWLWWLRWLLSGAGWIVTGLGAAAVTGIIKRDRG